MKPLYVFSASVTATAVMTLLMLIAPFLGLPPMNAGALLGSIVGGNETIGWIQHFVIGIIFAFVYATFFNDWLPVENNILRGTMYGIIVFVFSEINFTLINLFGFLTWHQKESMALMVAGNCLVRMAYGTILGLFFKSSKHFI